MKGSISDFYATLLRPQNQCQFTGLERQWGYTHNGNLTLRVYRDHFDQYRAVLFVNGQGASAVLVGRDKSIRFKYTKPEHRGQNYTRQIQAMLAVWGIEWHASEWQTQAGAACYG